MDKGIKNADVRVENRKRLLKLLYRRCGVSKQEIAAALQLSMPTVHLLVEALEKEGLLDRRRAESSSGGRIPSLLCLRYDARLVLGVQVEAAGCTLIITDLRGRILARRQVEARFNNGVTYWRGLRAVLLELIERGGFERSRILGVGVALHSTVNGGDVLTPITRQDRGRIEELLGFPVLLEWSAGAAGFANLWLEREAAQEAVYLDISRELGGAVMVRGQALRGRRDRCGDFGHVTLHPAGQLCRCGRRGCGEVYCSTRRLEEAVGGELADFFALRTKSEALERVWQSYCDDVGLFIANLNMALDLPVIVGGALGVYSDEIHTELVHSVLRHAPRCDPLAVCRPSVREDAPAVGAALMVSARYLQLLDGEN